jgi:hypothetical protein
VLAEVCTPKVDPSLSFISPPLAVVSFDKYAAAKLVPKLDNARMIMIQKKAADTFFNFQSQSDF